MTLYKCIEGYIKQLLVRVEELENERNQLIEDGYMSDAEPYEQDANIILHVKKVGYLEGLFIANQFIAKNLQSIIEEFEEDSE